MGKVKLKPSNMALQEMYEIGIKKGADHNLDGCNESTSASSLRAFTRAIRQLRVIALNSCEGAGPESPPEPPHLFSGHFHKRETHHLCHARHKTEQFDAESGHQQHNCAANGFSLDRFALW